ncbi:DUF1403 family protein [Bosea sp. F3-2]|uniref:DUF1403 family protein n=1 Tax=Bosea sp. F3-2 TaxID=2599640 RepID=UPI0020BE8E4A|nr:DUF1403 family protein [Bosea sp. F3-2]
MPDLPRAAAFVPQVVPAWAAPRGSVTSDVEAAFMAGSALNSLDNLVRAAPSWAGAWRQRLALQCAASAVGLAGRTESEAQLRDAWHWRAAGTDPGPAGNLLAAWRRLAGRSPSVDAEALRSIVGLLGLRWSDAFETLPSCLGELVRSGRPAPWVAAALAGEVCRVRPEAELLAWWLADLAIAARMRWPFGVPLLVTQARSFAFRGAGSRERVRSGGEGFDRGICVALALAATEACRLAHDIAPRAGHLIAVTPKLRAKGAGEVIQLLLDDDAVPGTLQTAKLTRWGSRRLFDRLSHLNAIRELSGRASFRLYGL